MSAQALLQVASPLGPDSPVILYSLALQLAMLYDGDKLGTLTLARVPLTLLSGKLSNSCGFLFCSSCAAPAQSQASAVRDVISLDVCHRSAGFAAV